MRTIPDGEVDVTAPVTIDGLSYIGDGHQPDPSPVPRSAAEAVPDVSVDQVYLPVREGVARCQLYRPASAPEGPLPVIVYYHGGGFTVGSSEDCDFLTRKLAYTSHALVASADYRSAPEFAFPRWPSFLQQALRGIVYDMAFAGFIRGAYVAATGWDHPWISPIEGVLGYPLAVVDAGSETVDYYPDGVPHGFCFLPFFPDVHPEDAIAYEVVASALTGPFGR